MKSFSELLGWHSSSSLNSQTSNLPAASASSASSASSSSSCLQFDANANHSIFVELSPSLCLRLRYVLADLCVVSYDALIQSVLDAIKEYSQSQSLSIDTSQTETSHMQMNEQINGTAMYDMQLEQFKEMYVLQYVDQEEELVTFENKHEAERMEFLAASKHVLYIRDKEELYDHTPSTHYVSSQSSTSTSPESICSIVPSDELEQDCQVIDNTAHDEVQPNFQDKLIKHAVEEFEWIEHNVGDKNDRSTQQSDQTDVLPTESLEQTADLVTKMDQMVQQATQQNSQEHQEDVRLNESIYPSTPSTKPLINESAQSADRPTSTNQQLDNCIQAFSQSIQSLFERYYDSLAESTNHRVNSNDKLTSNQQHVSFNTMSKLTLIGALCFSLVVVIVTLPSYLLFDPMPVDFSQRTTESTEISIDSFLNLLRMDETVEGIGEGRIIKMEAVDASSPYSVDPSLQLIERVPDDVDNEDDTMEVASSLKERALFEVIKESQVAKFLQFQYTQQLFQSLQTLYNDNAKLQQENEQWAQMSSESEPRSFQPVDRYPKWKSLFRAGQQRCNEVVEELFSLRLECINHLKGISQSLSQLSTSAQHYMQSLQQEVFGMVSFYLNTNDQMNDISEQEDLSFFQMMMMSNQEFFQRVCEQYEIAINNFYTFTVSNIYLPLSLVFDYVTNQDTYAALLDFTYELYDFAHEGIFSSTRLIATLSHQFMDECWQWWDLVQIELVPFCQRSTTNFMSHANNLLSDLYNTYSQCDHSHAKMSISEMIYYGYEYTVEAVQNTIPMQLID